MIIRAIIYGFPAARLDGAHAARKIPDEVA